MGLAIGILVIFAFYAAFLMWADGEFDSENPS